MAITITLPELGEGVDSVDVVAVLVAVGDIIEVDQGLIEVETEKASVEVPATTAGTVTEIHIKVGDVLGENAPIVTLDAVEAEGAVEPVPEPVPVPDEEQGRKGEREKGSPADVSQEDSPPAPLPPSAPSPPPPITPQARARLPVRQQPSSCPTSSASDRYTGSPCPKYGS
jgi:pyruvate dehydrogenase E2 component (dihydrolipoamide acetyltransferase)